VEVAHGYCCNNGSPSVFSTITSTGGGGGGHLDTRHHGIPGGSGGGLEDPAGDLGGTGNTPPVVLHKEIRW
jgi:hypothetical protein